MRRSSLALPVLLIGAALALAGCASGAGQPAASDGVKVVASTNVYGDIAKQIGGEHVAVTSIIDSPDKDPHDYAATPRDQLAVSQAALVIENGGHYDDYLDTMLASADNAKAVVLNASDISGLNQEPATGHFNEHVWYDVVTVGKLADRIAAELSAIDPANASSYRANAATFAAGLDGVAAREAQLHTQYAGRGVAVTEPVPLYLLNSLGLVNKTPEAFTNAVEQGTDVSPQVLSETEALFSQGQVALLVFNEQTSGAQTDALIASAGTSGVPAVGVTETLPAGKTYISWITGYLDAISAALGK